MSVITVNKAIAFVNVMPPRPTPGGTLHVITEIEIDSHKQVSLEKTVPQGINPHILLLNFVESLTDQYIENPQEIRYSEALEEETQYSSIDIRFDGETLATIKEIETAS